MTEWRLTPTAFAPMKLELLTLIFLESEMKRDQASLVCTTELLIELWPLIAPTNLTAALSVSRYEPLVTSTLSITKEPDNCAGGL